MNITKKISKKNNFTIILASLFISCFFFSATASAGTCGDGKRDLADGESCDPGQGAPDYCGVFGATCNSACQCIQKPAPTPTATPTSTPTPTPTPTATPTPSAGCMINCGCANYTQIGYTCDNGCGGTCAGKKDINQGFNCYSSPNNPTFPSYGYYSLDWWNHDYSRYYQPGTKLLKEECEGDYKSAHLCGLDSNNEVYWSFRNLQVLTNQKLCDMNHGRECIVACMNQIAIRFFLPPGALRLTVSRVTVEEDAYVNDVLRYNDLPTKIPSSSLSSGCGTTGVAACDSFTFDKIKQGQEFSGHSYPNGQGSAITKSNAGWLYYRGEEVKYGMGGIDFYMYVNAKIYNDWLAHSGSNADGSINWEKDVESVITYVAPNTTSPTPSASPTPTPITAPTGPDCAAKTCKGNSCDSQNKALDNPWISGTKTEGCATITATVEPNILTTPGSTFIKWTSTGASKVEAECFSGPIIIPRGGWFTSDAKCKESGLLNKECTDKGYEFKTDKELTGAETCKFYPTNSVGGQQGTPLVITFEVKKGSASPTPTPTINCTYPDPLSFCLNGKIVTTGKDSAGCDINICEQINCTYPDPLDFCPSGKIITMGKDSAGCDIHICEQINCNYPDQKDFCPSGMIIKTGRISAGCNVYECDKTTPTPTPTPTSQQKACENNCEQNVCVSKFCKDNCGDLVRGTRAGC